LFLPLLKVCILVTFIAHRFEVEAGGERFKFRGIVALGRSDYDHLVIVALIGGDVDLRADPR
jgi:hypothetical protein